MCLILVPFTADPPGFVLIDGMRLAHKSLSHVKVLQVKAAISTRISSKSHRTSVQCLGSALNGKLVLRCVSHPPSMAHSYVPSQGHAARFPAVNLYRLHRFLNPDCLPQKFHSRQRLDK